MAERDFEFWRSRAAAIAPDGRAFIDGERRAALSGETFARRSPIDGRAVAEIARCAGADIDAAVAAARRTYLDGVWRDTPPAEKKAVLRRFAERIREEAETLALLETIDVGKPIANTLAVDVPSCANAVEYYAELADKLMDEIAATGPSDQALVKRMPLGVVGAVIPWNYPLIIAGWKIGPALLMGNSVVLKPAEYASLAPLALGRLAVEAGLPPGVFNVVPGLGQEAGAALAAHEDVDMIAFTGSTATGRRIMEAAATSNLKRVALELGGKSPQIVFADCPDLGAAASGIAWSICYNSGQTCHAGSRLIVERSIAEPLYEEIRAIAAGIRRGHPLDPATELGALADPVQHARVAGYLDLAASEGGRVLFGGDVSPVVEGGVYVEPTLIADVAPDGRLAREEIFGPALVTHVFETDDEALKLAAGTDYGLAAAVWTRDMNRAHRFSEALAAGTVWINTYDQTSMATPFGGFKQSGFGRDRSVHAIEKYADLKTVWTHYGGGA